MVRRGKGDCLRNLQIVSSKVWQVRRGWLIYLDSGQWSPHVQGIVNKNLFHLNRNQLHLKVLFI